MFFNILLMRQSQGQIIELVCPEASKSLNLTASCIVKKMSEFVQENGLIMYDDGSQLAIDAKINFEQDEPLHIDVNEKNAFLIMNEQLYEEKTLEGFDIKASTIGTVNVSILELNGCHLIKSCLNYILNLDQLTNYSIVKTWIINLSENLTLYKIHPFLIRKGMVLVLNQSLSGKVQTVKSFFVSDYLVNEERKLINVNRACNSFVKFLIKPVTNSSNQTFDLFYQFDKVFNSPGVYNIMVLMKNISTSLQLNIINNRNLDLVCNSLIGSEYTCSVLIYSSTINELIQLNDQNFKLIPRIVDFLGFDFPKDIGNFTFDSNLYLLTSSEFIFDTKLRGFEIFALESGKIQLDLIEFSFFKTNLSCASQMQDNFKLDNFPNTSKTWVLDLETGLNRINFDSYFQVKKGSVFRLVELGAKIGIDNSSDVVSDLMLIQVNSTFFTYKLDRFRNLRFTINSILDRLFYQNFFFNYDKIESNSSKLITASLFNSNLTKVINLSYQDRKFFEIKCEPRWLDMIVDCSFEALSTNRDENFTIDVDGKVLESYNIKKDGEIYSSFGLYVPKYLSNATADNFSANSFLLLKTEFKFDAVLESIELYAVQRCSIYIKIINFSNLCGKSCGNYLYNISYLPIGNNFISIGTFIVESGYNRLELLRLNVTKGSMFFVTQYSNCLAFESNKYEMYSDFK
ncbi:unnamed protein product, partial [Brachionus calyciflorus]